MLKLLLKLLCSIIPAAMLALPALAQDFPARAVTIVVGYPPGGSNDIAARNVQAKLSERLGVPVIIENRPGAGGSIAAQAVSKAAPDGHTLLLTWDAHVINSVAYKDIPFDIFKDFVPVTMLGRFPLVMVAPAALPANNLKEFVVLAKAKPGQFNFASVGAGSPTRLHAENLASLAGMKVVHVPYKGGGPAIVALITSEVAFSFLSYASVKTQLDAGKLKALAVTGAKRLPELPSAPTMAESGFPDGQGYSWVGMFAPAGTPAAVVAKLHREFAATLADADVQKKFAAAGVEILGTTPQELDRYVRGEYDKWSKFARESKLNFAD
jgi:tripartite-type tricarboxylate transporter receptor subunit TctC